MIWLYVCLCLALQLKIYYIFLYIHGTSAQWKKRRMDGGKKEARAQAKEESEHTKFLRAQIFIE